MAINAGDRAAIAGRIRLSAQRVGGGSELARRSSIPRRTFEAYLTGLSEPKATGLAAIAAAAQVRLEWLITGDEPMVGELSSEAPGSFSWPIPSIPITGLAECGLKGWFQQEHLSVTATRPGDLTDPDAFAVIAIGQSMVPAGILQGMICFCSPRTPAAAGDAVYIEKTDETAAIKVFRKIDDSWLTFEGWLDPINGHRDIYTERLAVSVLRKLAPVIYVKRKL